MGRKAVPRPPDPVDGGPMLKMKELVEATGVSKATILYYLSQKLLPRPVKTSPNVAYYPISTIERVHLIRELQSRHRFSLAQIRAILQERDRGRDLESLIAFNEEIFGHEDERLLSRRSFCKACGLSDDILQQAIEFRLIIPSTEERFNSGDVEAGRILRQNLANGLTFEDLAFYPRLAEEIVSHEMALRRRLIRGSSYDEAMSVTLKMTHGARYFRQYVIERIFRQHALKQPMNVDGERLDRE